MNCRTTQRLSSAYLDGELDFETSAALRGHLRVCDGCSEKLADEQSVAAAARELEPHLDPPADLWRRINAEVARREVDDAGASSRVLWVRRWWSKARPYWAHGLVSVGLATAVVLLVVKSQTTLPSGSETADADAASRVGDEGAQSIEKDEPLTHAAEQKINVSHIEAAMSEIRRSDERYLTAIGELREIADSEKTSWTAAQRSRFEARNQQFEQRAVEIEKKMSALSKADDSKRYDPRHRDPLYKLYRQHLAFLEENVFGTATQNKAKNMAAVSGAIQ